MRLPPDIAIEALLHRLNETLRDRSLEELRLIRAHILAEHGSWAAEFTGAIDVIDGAIAVREIMAL